MPIPKEEFTRAANLDEDHKAVYDILLNEKENALTENDIIIELNDYIRNKDNRDYLASFELQKLLKDFKLRNKLELLVKLGLVKTGERNGTEYFYV